MRKKNISFPSINGVLIEFNRTFFCILLIKWTKKKKRKRMYVNCCTHKKICKLKRGMLCVHVSRREKICVNSTIAIRLLEMKIAEK